MSEKVLYFSLSSTRKKSFYSYIRKAGICYQKKFSFDLVEEEMEYNDPRDLLLFIEREERKDSLHVIIDYVSCCGTGKEVNYSTVLRSIIMCFPEVQFLFDETFVKKTPSVKKFDFLNFLFWDARESLTEEEEIKSGKPDFKRLVLAEFHQFDLGDFSDGAIKKQFILLLKGRNNIFDASNLRYAIKKQKFYDLSVKDNYSNLDESRCHHAAVVVEEEYHQSQFNSYCLYANGYRVFPIVSASELLWINSTNGQQFDCLVARFLEKELTEIQGMLDSGIPNNELNGFCKKMKREGQNIIDSFDGPKDALSSRFEKEYQAIDEMAQKWQNDKSVLLAFRTRLANALKDVTLLIRDYDLQFLDEDAVQSNVLTSKLRNEVDYIRGAKLKEDGGFDLIKDDGHNGENPYWKSFYKGTTYFVSKDDTRLSIKMDFSLPMSLSKDSRLQLRGIKKPLEGIYAWAHRIPSVQRRFEESRDSGGFDTARQREDGHSCPLDIYGIVRPMVHRAEVYYNRDHRYRLAALLAGEAIGILNGFHKSLMNKAYYIHAVAENAMAMCLLGGEESMLVKDVNIRLKKKVKDDVKRMISNRKDRFNLLNNIFNDCHLFCQKKEYFLAADQALSVMAHEREGIDLEGLMSICSRLWTRCKNVWVKILRVFSVGFKGLLNKKTEK